MSSREAETVMRFVLATDAKYWMPTLVTLYSLLEHNSTDPTEIFILCAGAKRSIRRHLQSLKRLHCNANIIVVDLKDLAKSASEFKIAHHLTTATYYRFFIDELLPGNIERIIYLDSDVLVFKSLMELYDIELGDNVIGAVAEPADKDHLRAIGLSDEDKYFNAGILVINLREWRRSNISNKLIECAKNNESTIVWPSQDPLNIVLSKRWLELSDDYNLRNCFRHDAVIVHFAGSGKPWHYRNTHPCKELYWKYIRKTPYRFYVPPDLLRGMLGVAKKRIVSVFKSS